MVLICRFLLYSLLSKVACKQEMQNIIYTCPLPSILSHPFSSSPSVDLLHDLLGVAVVMPSLITLVLSESQFTSEFCFLCFCNLHFSVLLLLWVETCRVPVIVLLFLKINKRIWNWLSHHLIILSLMIYEWLFKCYTCNHHHS